MVRSASLAHSGLMFHESIPDFFVVCLIFFGAGAVKGILGMGLPTLAMGLLGLVMPVASAASLLTLPSLATNLWQAVAGPGIACMLRRLWLMQAGIVVGVALAPAIFPDWQDALGRDLLGGCLVAYGVLGLIGWHPKRPPARWDKLAGLLTGLLTGIITGLTGVFVLPAVPYLQSLGLQKDALAQVLGMALGQIVRGGMGEPLFRRCFFIGLLLLGGWLLVL
jgi:uncharacterized membrane protein YfcA